MISQKSGTPPRMSRVVGSVSQSFVQLEGHSVTGTDWYVASLRLFRVACRASAIMMDASAHSAAGQRPELPGNQYT
jgi:hypothetical protein